MEIFNIDSDWIKDKEHFYDFIEEYIIIAIESYMQQYNNEDNHMKGDNP